MVADQNFYDLYFTFFHPTASATAEGENCAYGPTLVSCPQVPVCGCRNLEKGSHFAKFIWSESMN